MVADGSSLAKYINYDMINIAETINKGVIYKLESPSGKIYIGQSINFSNRIKKYKKQKKILLETIYLMLLKNMVLIDLV